MCKFHFFITTEDIIALREVQTRQAQKIFNDMLQHYNRKRAQGLHLLHAEDYFEMPLEAIFAVLHMKLTDVDWQLVEAARKEFKSWMQVRNGKEVVEK
jgi:hypothetical protein